MFEYCDVDWARSPIDKYLLLDIVF